MLEWSGLDDTPQNVMTTNRNGLLLTARLNCDHTDNSDQDFKMIIQVIKGTLI